MPVTKTFSERSRKPAKIEIFDSQHVVVELAVECTERWKRVCDHSSGHLDARECHHCSGHFTRTVLMVEERGREEERAGS